MGKRAEPYTMKEIFIAKQAGKYHYLPRDLRETESWNDKERKYFTKMKTPAEFRSFINRRKASTKTVWNGTYNKYDACVKALNELREATFDFSNLTKIRQAIELFREAEKYQGHLQMNVAFAEMVAEGKSDEELRRLMTLEAI